MRWSAAQQQAIEERNKNILVSAAAGSGKTAVLTERIKQLIVKDGVGIDKMLIVTFTNAAAGEMKERITKAISGELAAGGNAFLRQQLAKIHTAHISTFHSFCLHIIRTYFYLIDVRPDAGICDEAQKVILQSEAMGELFERCFGEQDEVFRLFLHKYADSRNEDQVKTMILSLYHFIQSIPNPFAWLAEKVESLRDDEDSFLAGFTYQYARIQMRTELARAREYMGKVLEIVSAFGLDSIAAKARQDLLTIETLVDMAETKDHDMFAAAISGVKFQTFSAKKEEKEAFEAIKEEVKFLRDRGKANIRTIAEKYMAKGIDEITRENKLTYEDARCLQNLVVQFSEIYGRMKEDRGLIDFHDAEHFALRILDDPQAANEYKEKFAYIFIDEYQDSNVVQDTLISRIRRENNLFMVGDVKQSIYRFRLAEPELFIEKYEQYKEEKESGSVKIDLNQNFRSKSGVIDFVNLIFKKIMTKPVCGVAYDEGAQLHKGLEYEGALSYPAEVHLVDEVLEAELADEIDEAIAEMKKTELEASVAAKLIRQTRGTLIFDEKKGAERNVSYRDMVVLFRAIKGAGAIYQEIFQKENIPVYAELEDGYFDTIEIGTFLNLLMVIDNKRQDLPLLGALRSGIFAFSTDELVEIRLLDRKIPFHEAFLQMGEMAGNDERIMTDRLEKLCRKCRDTLEKIEGWLMLSQIMPLEEFIWKLMEESGYYEYVAAMPGGVQRKANLRALADQAAAYQDGQLQGLFGFIRYAQQLQKSGVTVGQVRLLGESDDVVRLMTVHKSKGLEFPVIIAAGLGRRFHASRDSHKISLHRRIGLALRYVRAEDYAWQKTFMQEVIEQCEKKEAVAEEMRILYVALTRARDRLFLLGTLKNADETMRKYEIRGNLDAVSATCFLDWIVPAACAGGLRPVIHNRLNISTRKEEADARKETIMEGIRNGFPIDRTEENIKTENEIQKKLSWQYPLRQVTTLPSKYTVSEIRQIRSGEIREELPPIALPEELVRGVNRLTAAERGTAMHSVLQHLDIKGSIDPGGIRTQIAKMVKKEILTEEEAAGINCGKISVMLESPIGRRMRASCEIRRELTFNLKKSMRTITGDEMDSDEEVLIQGAIDCYFQDNGRYILLDYKTDRIHGEPDRRNQGIIRECETSSAVRYVVEKYRPQLSLYKEALETIKGIAVDEVYLYLFHIDCSVNIEI